MNIQSDITYEDLSQKRQANKKRRQMASSLRDARNKVLQNAGVGSREFEYELLQTFVRNELSSAFTIPFFAIIIAISCTLWAPINQISMWLICVFISKGIVLSLCWNFRKIPKEQAKTQEWRRKITAAEFLYAVTWSSIAFFDTSYNANQAYFFIFAAIVVMVAMRMMFASTVLSIVYICTIPMTFALTLRFLVADDMFYWTMAAMAIGIHLYFFVLVKSLHKNVLDMFAYRAEKDLLIAEIEEAKVFSDEARRQAEDANYAKSRFLATMSHELRTPLNAILGFSEVMKDEVLGPHQTKAYKGYANDIHESGQHLLKLINDILDLSRIEAGRYTLNEELLRLSDIVEDCTRLMKLRAESKNLELVEDFEDDEVKLWSDERTIRQIYLNLLSNAIKFTPSLGKITIHIALDDNGELILSVRDTGPGIPEEEIPVVLSNFGQGSLAHTTAEGGSGLGLPIVKGLIEMQGGTFKLESELRKGTIATLRFPAKRVTRVLPQISIHPEDKVEHDSSEQIDDQHSYLSLLKQTFESKPPQLRKQKPASEENSAPSEQHSHTIRKKKNIKNQVPSSEDLERLAYNEAITQEHSSNERTSELEEKSKS